MKVKRKAGRSNSNPVSLFAELLSEKYSRVDAVRMMFVLNQKLKLTDLGLSYAAACFSGISVSEQDIKSWRNSYNQGGLTGGTVPAIKLKSSTYFGDGIMSAGSPDADRFADMIASFHTDLDDGSDPFAASDDFSPVGVASGRHIREPDVDDSKDATPIVAPAKSREDWIKQVRRKVPVKNALKRIKGEYFHREFYKALTNGLAGLNTLLVGPTQCGKSELISQTGRAMGRKFGSLSCTSGTSETHLTGYLLPVGESGRFEFIETEFIRIFEQGGVFLFDEMDAADPNMLLVISQAFSQGVIPLPKRHKKPYAQKHKDFVAYASANTWGSGADRDYVGRNQLDAATLARFQAGTIAMDYDEELEAHLCPEEDLRLRLTIYRNNMREKKVRRWITTRFMADAYKMKKEWGWDDAMVDNVLFGGWTEVEISKVKGELTDDRRSTW